MDFKINVKISPSSRGWFPARGSSPFASQSASQEGFVVPLFYSIFSISKRNSSVTLIIYYQLINRLKITINIPVIFEFNESKPSWVSISPDLNLANFTKFAKFLFQVSLLGTSVDVSNINFRHGSKIKCKLKTYG